MAWGTYLKFWVFRIATSAFFTCEFLGGRLANLFGLNVPKYQYAIDEYYRREDEESDDGEDVTEKGVPNVLNEKRHFQIQSKHGLPLDGIVVWLSAPLRKLAALKCSMREDHFLYQGGRAPRHFMEASSTSCPADARAPCILMAWRFRGDICALDYSDQVIDTILHSRKAVTSAIYYRIWKIFFNWCHKEDNTPLRATILQILQFPQLGFQTGLKPASLKIQVSALGAILNKKIPLNSIIARVIKATMTIKPRIKTPMFSWDLNLVFNTILF
ncbi:hypothetical protein FKM82_010183 [Ascaphus truei]